MRAASVTISNTVTARHRAICLCVSGAPDLQYCHTNIGWARICVREEVVWRTIDQQDEQSNHTPRNCDAQQQPAQYSIEPCVVGEETPDEQG